MRTHHDQPHRLARQDMAAQSRRGGVRGMKKSSAWDETFLECAMEEVQEMIEDAIKSRRKHF